MLHGNSHRIADRQQACGSTGIGRMMMLGLLAILLAATSLSAEQKFHGHMAGVKLNYDSLWDAAVPLDDSKMGDVMIKHCIMTYGGEDHLRKLNSVRFTWKMSSMMSPDTIGVVKSVRFDRSYKIEREVTDGLETRSISNGEGWFQTPDTTISLSRGRYKSELFSYYVLAMPLAAVSGEFPEVRYGQRTNEPYHYIYLKKPDSLMLVISIDPGDYLIHTAEGIIYEDTSSFVFINNFGHHKKYDGYIFPANLTNISMGLIVGKSSLQKVELNVDFEESFFSPRPTDQ